MLKNFTINYLRLSLKEKSGILEVT